MKKNILLSLIAVAILSISCGDNSNKTENKDIEKVETTASTDDWRSKYDKIEASELPDNVFDLIGKQWMLVTAGNKTSFNTMTASWGGLTYVWEKPASIIYIRDVRYTYQFLQKEESFTLSFFTEQYRGALNICDRDVTLIK